MRPTCPAHILLDLVTRTILGVLVQTIKFLII